MKLEHSNGRSRLCWGKLLANVSVVGLIAAAGWLWPTQALAITSPDGCEKRTYSRISPDIARQAGMSKKADGQYEMDMGALASKAGGAAELLMLSRQQYETNKQWLANMESLVADPSIPMPPEVQAVYLQGWQTNIVEMSIINAMECLLGLPPSDLETPKSPALVLADREANVVQARAEAAAEARRQASKSSLNEALSGLAKVLSGVAGALNSASGAKGGAGGARGCPWDGYDYDCETAPGN